MLAAMSYSFVVTNACRIVAKRLVVSPAAWVPVFIQGFVLMTIFVAAQALDRGNCTTVKCEVTLQLLRLIFRVS